MGDAQMRNGAWRDEPGTTYAPYVCDGVPRLACSLSVVQSFLAKTFDGYWIEMVPRLATTSAAVYGRFTRAKRGFCGMKSVLVCQETLQRAYLPPLLDLSDFLGKSGAFLGHDGGRGREGMWRDRRDAGGFK